MEFRSNKERASFLSSLFVRENSASEEDVDHDGLYRAVRTYLIECPVRPLASARIGNDRQKATVQRQNSSRNLFTLVPSPVSSAIEKSIDHSERKNVEEKRLEDIDGRSTSEAVDSSIRSSDVIWSRNRWKNE